VVAVRANVEKQSREAKLWSHQVCGISVSHHPQAQFLLELAYTWTCVFTSQGPFTRFVPSGAGQSVSAIVARELSTLASVELAIGRTDPSTKPKFAWCG